MSQNSAAFDKRIQEHLRVVLFASGSYEYRLNFRTSSFRNERKVHKAGAEVIYRLVLSKANRMCASELASGTQTDVTSEMGISTLKQCQ